MIRWEREDQDHSRGETKTNLSSFHLLSVKREGDPAVKIKAVLLRVFSWPCTHPALALLWTDKGDSREDVRD